METGGEDQPRPVAVPGQKLRITERDGKKSTDNGTSEHEKDYNNKLGRASSVFPLGPTLLCEMRDRFYLFASEHKG